MAENRINNEGLFDDPPVLKESVPAADKDSILETDSEDEIMSTQKQRSPDPPKRRQDKKPFKPSARK